MGQQRGTPRPSLVHTGVLSPQSSKRLIFQLCLPDILPDLPGCWLEAPCACRAAVPGKKAETSVFAALGSSNPTQNPALRLIPIPTSSASVLGRKPCRRQRSLLLDGQARASLQRQREDGTSRIQPFPSQLLAKRAQLASPEPCGSVICFWPWLQALG